MSISVPPPLARSGNSLGFLRLLLAALVIYSHAHFVAGLPLEGLEQWSGGRIFAGQLAVQSFFVLSGCLVTMSWLRGNSSVRFIVSRALRIFPALWACLAVTALILGPLIYFTTTSHAPASSGYFAQKPSPWGYLGHNLFFPRRQLGIGEIAAHHPRSFELNRSLWTLAYEMSCYAMVLAAGLLGLLRGGRRLWLRCWILLLLGYVWTLAGEAPAEIARLYDNTAKEHCLHFLSGMVWAVFPEWTRPLIRRAWPAALAAGLLVVSWFCFSRGVLVSLLTLPIVLFYLGEHLPFRDWEKKLGGDYSYGMYLYGFPVQQTLVHFGLQRIGFLPWLLLCLAAAGGCAYCSWHWIEAPALRLKDRIRIPGSVRVGPAVSSQVSG